MSDYANMNIRQIPFPSHNLHTLPEQYVHIVQCTCLAHTEAPTNLNGGQEHDVVDADGDLVIQGSV